MSIITILLFFLYSWGLGFSSSFFIKNSENFFEKNIMRVGIGLGIFVVLGVILNFLHIPLDWRIFLSLSLVCPIWFRIKNKEFNFINPFQAGLTNSNINIIIVLIIFLFCCNMYIGGSFKYPYFEDDDPWSHALGAEYISVEKTAYEPKDYDIQYIDPYPPGYELLMGVLHQTSDSIYWTLKFFNGLIISLGILFFYFFAKEFTNDKNKALFATFVLAMVPSFFTHFIWSQTLAIMLFFPAIYCLEMIKYDKKWMYISMILIASIILTQPTKAIKILIMFGGYWLIKSLVEKKLNKEIIFSFIGSFLISLIWWATKWKAFFLSQTQSSVGSSNIISKIISAFPPDSGTATTAYTFNDFFFAQPFGMINVHIGWGIVISILLVLGLAYIISKYKEMFKAENIWIPVTLFWFIFTFLGTNSMTFNLPIGLYAFRFWLLMAIPVALLSSLGLWFLFDLCKKIGLPNIVLLVIVIFGVIGTAGYQKYNQNNAIYPPGVVWTSQEEIQGYLWLYSLPIDTKVFSYTPEDIQLIGFDKSSCEWCSDVKNFRDNIFNEDYTHLYTFLRSHGYEYLIISGKSYQQIGEKIGENQSKEIIDRLLIDIQSSNRFSLVYQTQGAIILKLI